MDYAASMGTSQAAIDSVEKEVGKSTDVEKKMRKKVFRFPQEKLEYYLSFRPGPVSRRLIEQDPPAAAEREKLRQLILTELERIRREYEAKGYATYEREVPDDGARYEGEVTDEEEEGNHAAAVEKQADAIIDEKKQEDASVIKQAEVNEKKEQDALVVNQVEKKEGDTVAEAEATDSAAPLSFPTGRGRRRFRPGVVKQAEGGVKKIIM